MMISILGLLTSTPEETAHAGPVARYIRDVKANVQPEMATTMGEEQLTALDSGLWWRQAA